MGGAETVTFLNSDTKWDGMRSFSFSISPFHDTTSLSFVKWMEEGWESERQRQRKRERESECVCMKERVIKASVYLQCSLTHNSCSKTF